MKYIKKGSEPQELRQWFKNQPVEDGIRLNCSYNDMPSEIRKIVKKRLLADQGYICCYTGIRITEEQSHIEHLKPQSLCRNEANNEDVAYNNLLAAHPGDKESKCPYGAHAKEDWYELDKFVRPIDVNCENKFSFDFKGEVKPQLDNDQAAKETIEKLKLNHESLTEMRKAAIDELIYEELLSLKQAETLLEKLNERDKEGRFKAFCFVLQQACSKYIQKKKQNQVRKKAIRSQDNLKS